MARGHEGCRYSQGVRGGLCPAKPSMGSELAQHPTLPLSRPGGCGEEQLRGSGCRRASHTRWQRGPGPEGQQRRGPGASPRSDPAAPQTPPGGEMYSPQVPEALGVPGFPEKKTVSGMGWAQSPLLCLQTCFPPSQIHPTAPQRRGLILQRQGPGRGTLCCPSGLGPVPAPGGWMWRSRNPPPWPAEEPEPWAARVPTQPPKTRSLY